MSLLVIVALKIIIIKKSFWTELLCRNQWLKYDGCRLVFYAHFESSGLCRVNRLRAGTVPQGCTLVNKNFIADIILLHLLKKKKVLSFFLFLVTYCGCNAYIIQRWGHFHSSAVCHTCTMSGWFFDQIWFQESKVILDIILSALVFLLLFFWGEKNPYKETYNIIEFMTVSPHVLQASSIYPEGNKNFWWHMLELIHIDPLHIRYFVFHGRKSRCLLSDVFMVALSLSVSVLVSQPAVYHDPETGAD